MAKWPKMMSTKDLSYISDMFNWNMTLDKQINLLQEQTDDEKLYELLQNIKENISSNCSKLIKLLESGEQIGK